VFRIRLGLGLGTMSAMVIFGGFQRRQMFGGGGECPTFIPTVPHPRRWCRTISVRSNLHADRNTIPIVILSKRTLECNLSFSLMSITVVVFFVSYLYFFEVIQRKAAGVKTSLGYTELKWLQQRFASRPRCCGK